MNALQKEIARLKARNELLERQLDTVIRAERPPKHRRPTPPPAHEKPPAF